MAYARPRNVGPFFSAAERIITTPGSPQTQDGPTEPADAPEASAQTTSKAPAAAPTGPATGAPTETSAAASTGPAGASALAEVRAAVRRRRLALLFSVALLAYLIDLSSKLLVVAKLEGHDPIQVIGDVMTFQVIRNAGAAFGMGQTMTVVFTMIAAAVIVVIWRISRRLYSLPWAIALGLLLGGALGNLTDRLFRSPGVLRGHVVDFISVQHFAVFNLADSAIVCGGILVVLLSFRGSNPDGSNHNAAAKGE
ncbi:signal peptidase II [Kitasatospora kifunensis]|uniref:Lipoprotein signal peptidase n=1 Tax=Kitasatospora kifunensis TaxID=58351 RepID=A0A7W7QZS2_KITKI|nr:signal peptidase II [Kitasatospora kifunensis]MBB4922832.1 signal peptidase II [Kitasatospora kifunensis]